MSPDDFKLYSTAVMPEFDDDFDALLNLDAVFDDGGVHGFTVDMDWLRSGGGGGVNA